MDCRIVVSSISELIDDGLTTQETKQVAEHLELCQPCQALKQDLENLRHAAQSLPLHTPGPTLWTRIRAEAEAEYLAFGRPVVEKPKPASWWDRSFSFTLPQLAGAAVMLVAAFLSSGYLVREYMTQKPQIGARDAAASILAPELEESLKSQLSAFNQRKVNWDPNVRADFEHHLQEIDESIAGCRYTLARNPDDQTQREMVRVLVDEKIRLLKDSSRLKW
jgi:anti-sigma factor RsiW